MCGIAGIFHYHTPETVHADELSRMSHHLRLRGPDGAGTWVNTSGKVGLVHRRLSIIDLSTDANQPMHDGHFSIVFNGEIYNHHALRDALIKKGYQFKTRSDTEVLLKLYQSAGKAMLNQLRGMFAFAIWDERKQTLFCARDHFGIKPFYFSDNGNSFRFASQVKTLLSASPVNKNFCAAGHVGFYLLGSVPEPYTLYQGIQSLPAGSYLIISPDQKIQNTYYSIASAFIQAENSMNAVSLTECLYDTLWHHLIADVDVGIFLSAGIDSSTIVNAISEVAPAPTTITLGFEEYKNTQKNEVPIAESVSRYFKTHHKTAWISEAFAKTQMENIITAMDQPSIDGVNTYFVSMVAAQQGLKVALSGLGADELFEGYPHFSRIPKLLKYARPFFPLGKKYRTLTQKIISAKKASVLEYSDDCASAYFLMRSVTLPWALNRFFSQDFIDTGLGELNLLARMRKDYEGIRATRFQIAALEIQWYMRNQLLRDSDWAGMAHGLEIRVPFVDVNFFEAVIQKSARQPLTKKSLAEATHRSLPDVVLNRKKTGFNIPVTKWYANARQSPFSTTIYESFI